MSTHNISRIYRNWTINDLVELRAWIFRQKHVEKSKQVEQDQAKKILNIEKELELRTVEDEGRESITREKMEEVTHETLFGAAGNFGIKKGVIG